MGHTLAGRTGRLLEYTLVGSSGGRLGYTLVRRGRGVLAYTLIAFLEAALLFSGGCGRETAKSPRDKEPEGITKTASEGPVTLSLTVRPADLPFDKHAELSVEALAPKGVNVDLADYEHGIEGGEHQFEYRLRRVERHTADPMPDGKLRWTQKYAIEFFLPGEYDLPAAELKYTEPLAPSRTNAPALDSENKSADAGATNEKLPHELKTETIKIVARATEQAKLSPEELKKIATLPPVELREPWSRWWLLAPVALFAAIGLMVWQIRRTRAMRVEPVIVIPAHEWARSQIASLIAADLIARGLVQEFYYRISAIVRGYIERRYEVNAPEMTTEEFLAAAARDRRFDAAATRELQRFLTACDLVKYARHRPVAGEWDDLLKTASDFVERTRRAAGETEHVDRPAATVLETVST